MKILTMLALQSSSADKLDETDANGKLVNREEAARLLSRSDYVGADYEVLKNSQLDSSTSKIDKRRTARL